MLHFAYGSNMHCDIMAKYAPEAEPLGIAALASYRFVITAHGYASVEPRRAETVYGVLWRLTPRGRIGLDVWEGVGRKLYSAETLPVRCARSLLPALVYVARTHRAGRPTAGYMELVIAAALEWQLPHAYIERLRLWLPKQRRAASPPNLWEFGWT